MHRGAGQCPWSWVKIVLAALLAIALGGGAAGIYLISQ